ncbi:MAG: ribosomal protein S18-alanine N-acetyltransferase [Roseinatronobacter sp.]
MTPDALADLHRRCFTLPPPWSEQDFAGFLADPQSCLVSRATGNDLLAFALFRIVLDEAELLTLATAPEVRRKGLARSLLAEGLARVQARGARACFLEVAAGNRAAIALYQEQSFAKVGERPAYYRSPELPPQDALVFRAALQDPV